MKSSDQRAVRVMIGGVRGGMIESRPMRSIDRHKLAALLGFHLLWGVALWFSISKLGLGISTDSVHLLFGGLNLSEGGRLISFDGTPVIGWPPLYPVLLGALHLATGLDVFAAAHVLQAASFAGLSACLSVLFLQIFPDDFALALAGNILSDIGIVVVVSFGLVGSDYFDLFLVLLYILLTAYYMANRSARVFVALAVVGMAAMLDRYLGIAATATGVACVLLMADSLRQRLARGLFLALSAVPASVWLILTASLNDRRAPISFAENFQWFSRSLVEWFLPSAAVEAHAAQFIAAPWILIIGLILLVYSARHRIITAFAMPVLLYGTLYVLALFGSASITYFNKLTGRFLLPLYVPFITLLLIAAKTLLQAAQRGSNVVRRAVVIGVFGTLTILAVVLLNLSLPFMLESHAGNSGGENAFNTTAWRANAILRYWAAHPAKGNYTLYSNYPDAVAFYTQHACDASPRQFSGPYGTVEFPVAQYAGELFSSRQDVYLIWIEPNEYDYYYQPEELKPIADVETVFTGKDGGIYKLKLRTGP